MVKIFKVLLFFVSFYKLFNSHMLIISEISKHIEKMKNEISTICNRIEMLELNLNQEIKVY